ncbi:PIN domain-containing protein [Paenibacillus xerothermodurans]|uniref:PIN domain-containing protein n=1 Tax=Paenibacillus xerothermodurans TaxID=1977292 RepID=UPI0014037C9C|nr:PIN domain-containing protein [Paenibacillus xerothermodurans]
MEKKTEIWIDTNIIIYTLRTNAQFSVQARQLVKDAAAGDFTLRVSPIMIHECVFVLQGRQFGVNKTEIKDALISLINLKGIDCEEKTVVEEALINFTGKGIDFGDAYLAAHARAVTPAHVITYNVKDFLALGVTVETPEQFRTNASNKENDGEA